MTRLSGNAAERNVAYTERAVASSTSIIIRLYRGDFSWEVSVDDAVVSRQLRLLQAANDALTFAELNQVRDIELGEGVPACILERTRKRRARPSARPEAVHEAERATRE